jgi:putative transport protein
LIWHWFVSTLQQNAELAVFLALAIGYLVGPLKLGDFHLGNVTATLLAGVLVGQLAIPISPPLKGFAFALFLFGIGYKVGPQFFAGLRRDGIPLVIFAVFSCIAGLVVSVVVASFAGFNVGEAAGLLAGSLTQSAAIGTASDAIARLGLDPSVTKSLQDQVALGYAVTYVFGTLAGVIVVSRIVPWLFRFDLVEECKKLAAQLGIEEEAPQGVFSAYTVNSMRALRVAADGMAGRRVGEIEDDYYRRSGHHVVIAAIRRGAEISVATPADLLAEDDVIAFAGPSSVVFEQAAGTEVHDPALLDIPLEQLDIVVTNRALAGRTVEELGTEHGRGISLKKITRAGIDIPVSRSTVIEAGDTLRVIGLLSTVEAAAKALGYALRSSPATDVIFVAVAILLGGLVGVLNVTVGGIPFGLGTSVGALLAGLVAGYLRSRSPTFGNVPAGAQWIFDTFALTVFIAVVGISAGPSFVAGVQKTGLALFVSGAIVSLATLILAACFGKFVLRLNNVILCGAIAGADTTTAALGAIQDITKSNLVSIGYTIPYAVGNIFLTLWGTVIVAIFASKTHI